jgi:mevalonate kinase
MNNFLDKDITYLNLSNNISKVLNQNNIYKVNDLWIKNKRYLKELGISDSDIKEIIIKLELNGYDLGKKRNK